MRPITGDIAVIGLALRLPGANDCDEYWENLVSGAECLADLTDDELRASGIAEDLIRNPRYVKRRGIVEDEMLFDAEFFDYVPSEAILVDPQQRIFLECSWEALENAGYSADTFPGSIGVYGAVSSSDYARHVEQRSSSEGPVDSLQLSLGTERDLLTARVSYKLGLAGPSMTVGTACSSSLVAVHLARLSLLSGDCDIALAGGVAIPTPQRKGYLYQAGGVSSPDGHCRAFDARAQGAVPGSGAAVVVLKRRVDAVADGDNILALVRGSAVNNDGGSRVGFTAPSVVGQARAIAAAQAAAGIRSDTVAYVEAHGTGTPLGDPVEVEALSKAFRLHTSRTHFCGIGSVKTNIGHLDAAAGVAGLIKTVLALDRKVLPPTLNFTEPNPEIDLGASPFYVVTAPLPWTKGDHPRRAGVSSFGMGGTNTHVVLEDAPPRLARATTATGPSPALLVVSAKTERALRSMLDRLADDLAARKDVDVADVAFTLQMGRRSFVARRALFCEDVEEAVEELRAASVPSAVELAHSPRLVFVFCGHAKWPVGFALDVYRDVPTFRRHADSCASALRRVVALDPEGVLAWAPSTPSSMTKEPRLEQARHFLVEYSLARTLMDWGIVPRASLGIDAGEVTAACVGDAIGVDEALDLIVESSVAVTQEQPRSQRRPTVAPERPARRIPWVSGAMGRWGRREELPGWRYPDEATAESDAIERAIGAAATVGRPLFLLLGRERRVRDLIADTLGRLEVPVDHLLGLRESGPASAAMVRLAGDLWASGADVAWASVDVARKAYRIPLPTYPFQRRRFAPASLERSGAVRPEHPAVSVDEAPANQAPHPRPALGSSFVTPRGEGEKRVALVWEQLFGVHPVGREDDFFELGGNSLLAARLLAKLSEDLGVEASPAKLFAGSATVAHMAGVIAAIERGGLVDAVPEAEDFRSDVRLDPAIYPEEPAQDRPPPRTALLTGGTGFIGSFLLRDLVTSTDGLVYCLVRAGNEREARDRIAAAARALGLSEDGYAERVVPIVGDLAKPLLGLDPRTFVELSDAIDAIYHCGAAVDFLQPYRVLRPSNVLGFQEILRLAARGTPRPVHHVSSLAIFSRKAVAGDDPIREDTSVPEDPRLRLGYSQSKWVSEKLAQIARSRGMQVSVYRPGIVAGDTTSARSNTRDFLWQIARACTLVRAAPEWDAFLPIVPVDFVSRATVRLSLEAAFENETYHLIPQESFRWSQLVEVLGRVGYRIDTLPYSAWRGAVIRASAEPGGSALLPLVPSLADELEADPRFAAPLTEDQLARVGLSPHPADPQLLERYVVRLMRDGFLPAAVVAPG